MSAPVASTSVKARGSTSHQSSPHGHSGWDLMRNRDFMLLWASQAVAQIGDGLIKVALLWFV